jgi:hypothetical protein
MEVGAQRVLVGLGRLQDLLQEGVLIVPDRQDNLVLRGQVAPVLGVVASSASCLTTTSSSSGR